MTQDGSKHPIFVLHVLLKQSTSGHDHRWMGCTDDDDLALRKGLCDLVPDPMPKERHPYQKGVLLQNNVETARTSGLL